MSLPADIVLFDELGRILLMAEVEPVRETTPQWAAEVRGEVLQQSKGFVPPYFLVIAPDTSYFWTSDVEPAGLPGASIRTEDLFRDILERVGSSASDLAGSPLELVAGIWLRNLTRGPGQQDLPLLSQLAAAAENGRIQFAAAA